jgi:hypothetical protein
MSGDCYRVGLMMIVDLHARHDNVDAYRLCHGAVVGNGGDVIGVRLAHCWVEHTRPDGRVDVIDQSNGNDIALPRDIYYRIGRVEPDTVIRYEPHEAMVLAIQHEHYGPWHEEAAA